MDATQEGTATIQEMSAVDIMPLEIWGHIFLYLPQQDVLRMRLVSRDFRDCSHRSKVISKLTFHLNEISFPTVKQQLENGASGCSMITMFKRLQVIGLHSSSSLEFVLDRIGAQITYLELKNTPIFGMLNEKFPNIRTLVVKGEYNKSDIQNLDMCTFRQLESVDISDDFLSADNLCSILNGLKTLSTNLKSLYVVCASSAVEDALTSTLQLYAASLEVLAIQCRKFIYVEAKFHWLEAFRRMRKLRQLQLEGSTGKFIQDILFALSDAPLECLLLNGILEFRDDLLKLSVHQWCATLQYLRITYCAYITDGGLTSLDQIRHRLRRLEICSCFNISGSGLLKALANDHDNYLTVLNISDNYTLEANYFSKLLLNLTKLESLRMANCQNAITNNVLAIIFANLTRLKCLDVSGATLINNTAMLKSGSSIGIANLRDLEELNLRGCQNLTDVTLREALKFRKLRLLDLRDIPRISVKGVERLVKNCPALEELKVNRCRCITNDNIHNIICHSPLLSSLSLSEQIKFTASQIDYLRRVITSRRK